MLEPREPSRFLPAPELRAALEGGEPWPGRAVTAPPPDGSTPFAEADGEFPRLVGGAWTAESQAPSLAAILKAGPLADSVVPEPDPFGDADVVDGLEGDVPADAPADGVTAISRRDAETRREHAETAEVATAPPGATSTVTTADAEPGAVVQPATAVLPDDAATGAHAPQPSAPRTEAAASVGGEISAASEVQPAAVTPAAAEPVVQRAVDTVGVEGAASAASPAPVAGAPAKWEMGGEARTADAASASTPAADAPAIVPATHEGDPDLGEVRVATPPADTPVARVAAPADARSEPGLHPHEPGDRPSEAAGVRLTPAPATTAPDSGIL
ncbi:MAG: hypothetical protein ACJ8GN_30520, partial [Longimicrobiaceae bacterium]